MVWDWWWDWRERRSALKDLKERQRFEEAVLMDQNLNPLNLAKLSLDSGDSVKAASLWQRARAVLPNAVLESPDSLEILLGLKRYDEADALMRERGKRFPGDRFYLTGLARIAEQRGDLEDALKRWIVARDHMTDTIDGYHGCARCLIALDRLDEAEAQYDAALRRGRDNLDACIGRALISDRRKDWGESLVRWKHVADTFRFGPAFAFYAKALVELGRVDEADAWLEVPSRIYPSDLEIAVTRSHLALRRGDLAAACDRWARVRGIDPYFQTGYHEGANRLVEAERHAEAEAVLRAAIERFPDQIWPLRNFARLAHDRRDWNEAATRWDALRQRFPEEEAGYSLGAEALKAAGRDDEAAALHRGP
jgi:tetratricopeptide (TPR) repeat protein